MSWLEPESGAAVNGLVRVVAEEIERRLQSGEEVPEPLATKKFSGRFGVRITPELHRRLATESAEQKVSMNRLVSDKLAR
jgi:predicted HicB family RNase H-like nuclease